MCALSSPTETGEGSKGGPVSWRKVPTVAARNFPTASSLVDRGANCVSLVPKHHILRLQRLHLHLCYNTDALKSICQYVDPY